MHTRGTFAPETVAEARERYAALGPVAQQAVREAAKAMGFDREEYEERVTPAVVEQVRNALFATALEVRVGSREAFDDWAVDHDGELTVVGSEHVDNVAWHVGPDGAAVAATYQDEADAAVETLRRQAFGRLYREMV
jgi:hypothetical protein